MFKAIVSRWIVPVVTLLVILAIVATVLKLSQKVGENLAPIKPRVLVFGATYCGACPSDHEIDQLRKEFPHADIEHIQIDASTYGRAMQAKYHIHQTPTFIVCTKAGCKVFYSLSSLRSWLKGLLGAINET